MLDFMLTNIKSLPTKELIQFSVTTCWNKTLPKVAQKVSKVFENIPKSHQWSV